MKLKKAQKSVKGKEKPAKNVKPKEKVAKISEKPVKPKEKAVKTSKSEKKKQNDEKIARAESILSNFEKPTKPQDPVITKNANKRHLKKALGQDGLLVKHQEGTKWYSYQIDKLQDENEEKMEGAKINELLIEGRDILAQDSALLQTKEKQENGSEASWLYSVISKGTASDKRTAMQLQMHKSPIHSLEYVERLIGYCAKQGTRDIIDVIPILEDVFANHCLPENRKLVPFSKRPFGDLTTLSSGNDRSRRKILLLWAFEHELKILYQQFIQALVEIVKRPLEDVVKKALRTLANLLISRPESESLILSALVNSFGHPNYKIGSHSVHLFEDISRKHPAMRIVIVDEIERLIFRKNVNERAHLYSVTFLSQMKFSTRDSGDLTCRLMSIYLSLFKTIVHKKITDNRLLPIILAGANRAFPYAKDVDKLLGDVKDVYYLAHNSNYRTAIPALRLLFQFHKMNDYVSDRFYNALYRKLLDTCPPAAYAQLLKLLFDTMKEDPSAQRVRAFVKRLLQVAVNVSSEFAASILILISKLKTERKDENLLILSKDADPSLRVVSNLDDDEDEERYVDLDAEGNEIRTEVKGENKAEEDDDVIPENADEDTKKIEKGKLDASSNRGWVHRKTSGRGAAKTPYDPMARNPLFVDAQHVADNELLLLSNHFHPSVSVFAKCLLEGGEVKYGGDALNDFTLMAFLDRFAFRNPKEITTKLTGRVVRKKAHDPWGVRKLAVDSNEYTQKKRDEIPADERFLHRYASTVYRDKKVKKEEGKEDEDEWEYAESVNSEEFDTIMERFEPGELNEEFDIDYSKEFSSEKNKRNKPTIADEDVDMDEDDDLDLDDGDDEPEDGMEDGDDIEDDDDDEEPEDDDDDDDDDNDFDGRDGSSNVFGDDESSDEEIGENDYELAGDRFAEMLENLEEEEHEGGKGKKKGNAGGKKKFNAKRPAAKKGGFKGAKRPRRH